MFIQSDRCILKICIMESHCDPSFFNCGNNSSFQEGLPTLKNLTVFKNLPSSVLGLYISCSVFKLENVLLVGIMIHSSSFEV